LLKRLRDLVSRQTLITDVRGRGLMIGVDFLNGDTAKAVEQAAFRVGLLMLTCGERVVRIAPRWSSLSGRPTSGRDLRERVQERR